MIHIALYIISFIVIFYAILFIGAFLVVLWNKITGYIEDIKINKQDIIVVIICLSLAIIGFLNK